jgi:hypothetical protein
MPALKRFCSCDMYVAREVMVWGTGDRAVFAVRTVSLNEAKPRVIWGREVVEFD